MTVRRRLAVLLLIGASGVAACIIGPKQDDPADQTQIPVEDVGIAADTAPDFGSTDTGTAAADTETPPFSGDGDAAADGDARADGDVRSDGASDGVTEGG